MSNRTEIVKAKTYMFTALSDGRKRTFTNKDGLKGYPGNVIRDPGRMSYTNLFINGVLQPPKNYWLRRGLLQLRTIDAPPKGAPIMLQFVRLYVNRPFPLFEDEEE